MYISYLYNEHWNVKYFNKVKYEINVRTFDLWPLTLWPKINRHPLFIGNNLYVKFESDGTITVVCIVHTRQSVTDGWTDRQTHTQTLSPNHTWTATLLYPLKRCCKGINIVAAFRGMHALPVKHSYAWLPKVWLLDRHTDAGQSDPFVPLCFAGDTKMAEGRKEGL